MVDREAPAVGGEVGGKAGSAEGLQRECWRVMRTVDCPGQVSGGVASHPQGRGQTFLLSVHLRGAAALFTQYSNTLSLPPPGEGD